MKSIQNQTVIAAITIYASPHLLRHICCCLFQFILLEHFRSLFTSRTTLCACQYHVSTNVQFRCYLLECKHKNKAFLRLSQTGATYFYVICTTKTVSYSPATLISNASKSNASNLTAHSYKVPSSTYTDLVFVHSLAASEAPFSVPIPDCLCPPHGNSTCPRL